MPSSNPSSAGPLPTIDDIRAAAERLKGKAVLTPLLESPALNKRLGGRLLVKAEALQRTGSFKFRGAYNALVQFDDRQRRWYAGGRQSIVRRRPCPGSDN